MPTVTQMIEESIAVKWKVQKQLSKTIEKAATICINALKKGNKLLIAGNGGSASDAQHFSAELLVRYKKERKSLPAIALTTDASTVTACGNDYGFPFVFSRQIESLAQKGDVFVGISTSGNSLNIINAVAAAKKRGASVLLFLGKDGGALRGKGDLELIIPSDETARIQESHIMIIHIICESIDEAFA